MASRRGQILLAVFLLIRVLRHAASPLFQRGRCVLYPFDYHIKVETSRALILKANVAIYIDDKNY